MESAQNRNYNVGDSGHQTQGTPVRGRIASQSQYTPAHTTPYVSKLMTTQIIKLLDKTPNREEIKDLLLERVLFMIEIERLSTVNSQLMSEIESVKKTRSPVRRENVEAIISQNEKLNEFILQMEKQIEDLQTQNAAFKSKEAHFMDLQDQNHQLNAQLTEAMTRIAELEGGRQNYQRFQPVNGHDSRSQPYSYSQNATDGFFYEANKLREINSIQAQEIEQLKRRIEDLEKEIPPLSTPHFQPSRQSGGQLNRTSNSTIIGSGVKERPGGETPISAKNRSYFSTRHTTPDRERYVDIDKIELQTRLAKLGADHEKLKIELQEAYTEIETLTLKLKNMEIRSRSASPSPNKRALDKSFESVGGGGEVAQSHLEKLYLELNHKQQQIAELNAVIVRKTGGSGQLSPSKLPVDREFYENRHLELVSELSKTQALLHLKTNEAESWKEKFLKKDPSTPSQGVANKGPDPKLSAVIQENERLNSLLTAKTLEAEEIIKKLEHEGTHQLSKIRELENINTALKEENTYITSLLEDRKNCGTGSFGRETEKSPSRREEKVKMANNDNESVLKQSSDPKSFSANLALKSQLEELKAENESVNNLLKEKSQELQRLKGQLLHLESTKNIVQDLETQIQFQKEEIEHLNKRLGDRLKDIETWRDKYYQQEKRSPRVSELEAQVQALTLQLESLNNELSDRLQDASEMMNKLQEAEEEKNQRIPDLEEKLAILTQELEKLTASLIMKTKEAESWKARVMLEDPGQGKVRELELEVEQMIGMNQKLNQMLGNKIEELELERKKRQELEKKAVLIPQLERKISLFAKEIERLQGQSNT